MRVAVIGAGLAGVTTAFELALDGHDVLVLDRGSGIATEGSFAPGGLFCPEYLAAWGTPGLPRHLFSTPWQPRSAWSRDGLPVQAWPWLWRARQATRAHLLPERRAALLSLAQFSAQRLDLLSQQLHLDFEQCTGQMVLLRSAQELARLQAGLDWLQSQGAGFTVLDEAGARALEPALSPDAPLHAAIQLPAGRVSNSRQVSHQLKAQAQSLGVQWRFRQEVLDMAPGQPWQLTTRQRQDPHEPLGSPAHPAEVHQADAVVLCAAGGSIEWLSRLGMKLPLMAVQSHSITAAVRLDEAHDSQLPIAGMLDERAQVSIARLGDRVRVSGGAALAGGRKTLSTAVLRRLYQTLDTWFPGAAHTSRALQWQGCRWLTPDGLPVHGPVAVPGLWLNLGLGAGGWTLACGLARGVADQLSGHAAHPGLQHLSASRLR